MSSVTLTASFSREQQYNNATLGWGTPPADPTPAFHIPPGCMQMIPRANSSTRMVSPVCYVIALLLSVGLVQLGAGAGGH